MNDLISRSALLEVTPEAVADEESNQNEIAYAEGWNDCLESFCSIVKYAPAVDAEVVRHEENTTFVTTDNLDAYADRIIVIQGNLCKVYYRDSDDEEDGW